MLGDMLGTNLEGGRRGGKRHGRERVAPSESKAICLACLPGTTRETWNMEIYVSSQILP